MTKKSDLRRKVKLTIEVTHNDLVLFEDYNMCIPLCNKHKGFNPNDWKGRPEREQMTMRYECKDCEKVWKEWKSAAERIEGRLWRELCKKFGWE